MRYRMKKPPTGSPQPKPPRAGTPIAFTVGLEPDPARAEVVASAFVAYFGRLEALLGDRWAGAWDMIGRFCPPLAVELKNLEAHADGLAAAYIRRAADEHELRQALEALESAWARAAGFLKTVAGLPGQTACAACTRVDSTVMLVQDDGTALCSRCVRDGFSGRVGR